MVTHSGSTLPNIHVGKDSVHKYGNHLDCVR